MQKMKKEKNGKRQILIPPNYIELSYSEITLMYQISDSKISLLFNFFPNDKTGDCAEDSKIRGHFRRIHQFWRLG